MTKNAREVILAVMQEVQAVAKNDKNTAQNFNFRGIDAVINKVGPALRSAGGFILPKVIDKSAEVVPSKSGGSLNVVRLTVNFEVYGSEGEPIIGTVVSEAFDSGDKATAKAMSVALRTFLLQTLALPTDEKDPDADSYEIGHKAEPAVPITQDRIDALNTVEELRDLYNIAIRMKAPKPIVEAIQAKGETFAK
jgi:hypothetical protein